MHNFSRTLTPEQFVANVAIHADGSYTYSYDGVLIFVPALTQVAQAGFCARCERQLGKLAAQLRKEGFRKAEYRGGGRYAVVFEGAHAKGEPLSFLSRETPVFSITPQLDGAIEIGAFHSDALAQRRFTESGAKINGALNVEVDIGVKVLRHNAPTKPSINGSFAGYNWQIKSPDADPFMIVRPAQ
jgi:hypothetical protein